MNGALRRWMKLWGELYHANGSRSVEGFHSAGSCGCSPHGALDPWSCFLDFFSENNILTYDLFNLFKKF